MYLEFGKLVIPIIGMIGGCVILWNQPDSQLAAALLGSGITGYFGNSSTFVSSQVAKKIPPTGGANGK